MARVSAAERRNDLVKAAVQVIATHGIDGATTRRIAEQAGAPLAALHYCYDSKEDLFTDVYAFVTSRFQDVIVANDPHADLPATARHLLRGLMELYVESADFTATTQELASWATRQQDDRGIGIYDKAMEATRSILAGAAPDLEPDAIDRIGYVIAILADGFALNWATYGNRSAATDQMRITESVLDAWLAAQLEPASA